MGGGGIRLSRDHVDRRRRILADNRYLLLLATLLSLFLAIPLVPYGRPGRLVLVALGLAVLLTAMRAVWRGRRVRYVALAAGVGGAVAQSLPHGRGGTALVVTGDALRLVFFVLVAVTVLSHVMRSDRVTLDAVFGAACVYLLLGLIWARAFTIVETVSPGSFHSAGTAAATWETGSSAGAALVYYSFVTLTTVGYGDISPASPPARALAMLEGLVGQLFIAILVARMVGLHLAGELADRGREN